MNDIDELLTRGVANVIPDKSALRKALTERKLNIYLGIDPTATKIHLGHAVALIKLQKFVELGHNVTFLIGDFTALVGDTSDKDSERPILTPPEIEENFKTYKEQAEKVLDFSKVKVVHNSDWLSKLTYKEILGLKRHFSLNDFISRELIKKRLNEGKSVRLDETEYPIMQGYDSYFMDTDLQIGGADQTFNMQAGRTLQKALRGKDTFVLSTEYLTGTDGRKMSKSWGNAIWLNDTPGDMYGKVMSIKDDLIIEYFTLATNVSPEEIEKFKQKLDSGANPIEIKKKLAHQIVSELYNENEAEIAQKGFQSTVQNKELPEEINILTFGMEKMSLLDIITDRFIKFDEPLSRSEARRLIEQGGVEIDGKKIENPKEIIEINGEKIIKIGKRTFVKIKPR